ncbi:14744_t:CDS:2 [Rhizophagus irregularis]|nr:14744_t:CDS:2 [Rhizophagus irregularis]
MDYLDTINLNLYAAGGPPESWKRAMGILRSCMTGEAAEWFDREITGKNCELSGITSRSGANLAAFVALVIPEAAGEPNAGTYVNGSKAQVHATDPVNALATIRAAFIPTHNLMGGNEAWGRAGARLTDRAAPLTADAGVAANNNHPIVFPGIKPNQALYWLRTQFPTVIDEKKSLYQENEPVDAFYRTVKRAEKLLKLTDDLIIEQFFKGLSADNIFEAERFHNLNPDDLVKHLRNLERRRAEMRLGLQDRNRRLQADYSDVTQPPLGKQEPVG